ncbi:MAG: hypothetical protein Q8J92_06050 [Parvibaculum sp.]|nr:hypothetical protein [Parvibaculum sp.]
MVEDRGDTFTVLLYLRRADGRIVPYRLWIDARTVEVEVREAVPDRLPTWCPELHINNGGLFCLGYGADAPDPVTSAEAADNWWGIVISFLKLQERAKRLKRWPNGNAWAHGGAAKHQAAADKIAAAFDAGLYAQLRAGHLRVEMHKGRFLRVMAGEKHIYSVWNDAEPRIVNVRRPCMCGSGRPMNRCGNHADLAAGLASALSNMVSATAGFWDSFQNRKCCERTNTCPLLEKEKVAGPT